jgi:hypothetical protein
MRTWLPTIAGMLLAIVGGYTWWCVRTRQLPFDPKSWAAAGARLPHGSTRYRMSQNLINRINAEHWTYDRTLKELGAPQADAKSENLHGQPLALSYLLGKKSPSLFGSGYYLLIQFDENGRLLLVRASPQ